MEIGNLYLIPISIFLNFTLFWVQKHYLIKWFCRTFLYNSVQLECDLKEEDLKRKDESATSNGDAAVVSNGHHKVEAKDLAPSNPTTGKKLVTDGDISGCAMENVGSLIAAITALVSAIVMFETRHDTVNARSSILIPWCHIAAWYFIVDLHNMYDAFSTKNDISHLSWHQRYITYVRAKWPYVLHHVVLFTFGYQVVVNDYLRGYKGDFYVAAIIGEDFSNPLVNSAKVLKMLGQDKTIIYIANGFLLVFVFFVVRILNIPFVLLVYAAQYHNWNIISALRKLRVVCYVSIILQYCLQFYWFNLIVKLALKSFKSFLKSRQGESEGTTSKKKTE